MGGAGSGKKGLPLKWGYVKKVLPLSPTQTPNTKHTTTFILQNHRMNKMGGERGRGKKRSPLKREYVEKVLPLSLPPPTYTKQLLKENSRKPHGPATLGKAHRTKSAKRPNFPPPYTTDNLFRMCVNVSPFLCSPQTSFSPLVVAGRLVLLCGVREFLTLAKCGVPVRCSSILFE